jgi:ribosomal subunit interface protein
MKVTVHGHHMDVGESFESYISEKAQTITEKYFQDAVAIVVTMEKDTRSLFKCHISISIGTGNDIHIEGTAKEHEAYTAFDEASDKVAKQLRRYKSRLKDRSEKREAAEAIKEYTLGYTISDEQLDQVTDKELDEQGDAVVVAEMTTNIQTMTVSEAAMRLNLSGSNAMMFRNASHGEINMVYVRKDGNVGWVDPKETVKNTKVA